MSLTLLFAPAGAAEEGPLPPEGESLVIRVSRMMDPGPFGITPEQLVGHVVVLVQTVEETGVVGWLLLLPETVWAQIERQSEGDWGEALEPYIRSEGSDEDYPLFGYPYCMGIINVDPIPEPGGDPVWIEWFCIMPLPVGP